MRCVLFVYEQAAINEGTEFVYGDFYGYGGTLNSRPIGYYWSASVNSAAYSRNLYFDTNGTTRNLYPQYYHDKGDAFAVRCVVAGMAMRGY